MSEHIRRALADLEQDVATLTLAPPREIRALGTALRRRQVSGVVVAAVAGVAVTGAVALPSLQGGPVGPGTQPTLSPSRSHVVGPLVCASGPRVDREYPNTRFVRVVLKLSATPAEREAIQARLNGLPEVVSATWESHELAYERFKQHFCDNSDLVASTHPEVLPESFLVLMEQPDDDGIVRDAVTGMPGVEDVVRIPD